MQNRFDLLIKEIKGNLDILVISETKLDYAFLEGEFKIPGFGPAFWKDQNQVSGIMFFIRKDFMAKLLFTEKAAVKAIFIK